MELSFLSILSVSVDHYLQITFNSYFVLSLNAWLQLFSSSMIYPIIARLNYDIQHLSIIQLGDLINAQAL